ncbi:hypothetical protein [Halovivax sp.]|nr:hypothetical protein [Halovivax sp.]
MKLRKKLKRLVLGESDESGPSCSGCGRPVSSQGEVCANCRGSSVEDYGG